jgi:hypothetical protein
MGEEIINKIILLLSISVIFAFDMDSPNPNTPLVLIGTSLVVAFSADVVNCMNPYYNGEHENIGMFIPCSWEEEDFYYKNGRYILHKTDSDDNWIEKRMRKRYWRRNH